MKHCSGLRPAIYGIVILCYSLAFLKPSVAQNAGRLNPEQLSLSLIIVDNNYQKTDFALAKLTLSNNGKQPLPASGWKIYFNTKSPLRTEPRNSEILIKRGIANLFELSPTASFKGIKPGKSYKTDMVIEDQIYNINDQPEGFYLVWNDQPTKGYNIKMLNIPAPPMEPVNGRKVSDFAATIYQRDGIINRTAAGSTPKVFPTPVKYEENKSLFIIDGNTIVSADPAFSKESEILTRELEALFNKKPAIQNNATGRAIRLSMKQGLDPEAYELTVNTEGIMIQASSAAGIFYGIQSLKTLLPPAVWGGKQTTIQVPGVSITDAPRFSYRGFMLDVTRNFQTKEEVKRVLNLMALYKLNTFHFHITDDEGWRLEIDGIPELTSISSNRGHTLDDRNNLPSAYGSGADTAQLYGSGHYTAADFIEILRYANDRHIKVIPEIETPGHARAAIKAMNARYSKYMQQGNTEEALRYFLADTADQSQYSTPQSFHDNVINVALPSVYTFIAKVVEEVHNLYQQAGVPLTTMHFGGDEVPVGTWERSPACNDLIKKDPALHNTNDLWYYYLARVDSILKKKKISLAGWEEMGLRKTVLDSKKVMIPNGEFINKGLNLYV